MLILWCSCQWFWFHRQGHHIRELRRTREAPSCGSPYRSGSRGGVPLQRHRIPGHYVCPFQPSIFPRMRHLRNRRLHIRQCCRGVPELQSLGPQANGPTEEHHHGPESQRPESEHGHFHTQLSDPCHIGSRSIQG